MSSRARASASILSPLLRVALLVGLALAAGHAQAQTLTITFQKVSDTDDSVGDTRTGFPPARQCPLPCQTVHYIIRIINCTSATPAGVCSGPNPRSITGGAFVDTPPWTLPLDCSRGVTMSGGTSDPATCDPATNTVTVNNITVPPGGTFTISFWSNVDCTEGVATNQAYFNYDQNPGSAPIAARDPVGGGISGLNFRVGEPSISSPTKDAPSLPINMGRRYGNPGTRVPWIIQGQNTNCAAITFDSVWDSPDPFDCITVDCSTVRLFINDVPAPIPGFTCPNTTRPAPFSLGPLTLQPQDRFRILFDGIFTPDGSIGRCCNIMFFEVPNYPLGSTVDPTLDTRLTPEYTCAQLGIGTATQLDAIKDAEDGAGNRIREVRPGDDIFWRFKLTVNGADPVSADLTDDFPPAAVLGPASIVVPFPSGTCVITGQNLSCTGINIPGGSTVEMLVRTTLDCAVVTGGDRICNEGTMTVAGVGSAATHCTECLAAPPGNVTCVTLVAPSFEFAAKTATEAGGDGQVAVGERITYRIAGLNSGTSDASGVVITDAIPANTTFVPGSLALDGAPLTEALDADAGEVVGNVVTVRVGNVPVLDFNRAIVTFDVTVDARVGTEICNAAAELTWTEGAACGLPPKSMAPACLPFEPIVSPPALSASKSVTPLGAVDPGTVLRYAVGVCNAVRGGDATVVELDDDVLAGATYVPGTLTLDGAPLTDAVDADAGDVTAGRVHVSLGTLLGGECRTVGFDVQVDAGTTADVTNKAVVQAATVAPFNSNTVITPVNSASTPQLSITKTSSLPAGPPARVGDVIRFDLTACNAAGAAVASTVTITDAIPLDTVTGCGATYVAGSLKLDGVAQTDVADGDPGRFEALPAPGGVVVALPSLAPGTCVDVSFDVLIAAGCDDAEVVENTATVAAAGVSAIPSNTTVDVVTGDQPPAPVMLRKEGFPLVNRCPNPPVLCGCEVGVRLDPILDDCVAAGTCAQLDPATWRVPNDLNRRVPLVFYELSGGGCLRAGDPTRLAVTKNRPDDILLTLVP